MKILVKWLKEFIKTDLEPSEIAEKLTMVGLEVDKVEDNVIDIEINPNRGDCLSILGIARELGAILNKTITLPKSKFKESTREFPLIINIQDPEICPRYSYRIITGIKIADSPRWIQEKLAAVDFRPVSNVVDITNYVMIELGQPLHAFDYDKISQNKEMIIRRAKAGEKVITLDGKKHSLDEEAIVIENDKKLIDLAGIMGGKNSEVDSNTKTIILQAALFNPALIRKTSKKLRFSTEASYRYERGVDSEGNIRALNRATDLILKIAGGQASKIVDIIMKKFEPKKIEWTPYQINSLLGTDISIDEMENYLKRLGFKIYTKIFGKNNIKTFAEIPSWRDQDINFWQDLAEEVARIYSYNKIEAKVIASIKKPAINKEFIFEQNLANLLQKLGIIETLSYSFISKKDLEVLGIEEKDCVEIINPISFDYQYLRPKLLPSILKQIAKNPWAPEIKIFEIGKVFSNEREKKELIIATSGKQKKLLCIKDEIISKLNLTDFPSKIYPLNQNILKAYKIRRPLQILDADFNELLQKSRKLPSHYDTIFKNINFQPVSKYPPVVRDLAFIVDKNINYKDVIQTIKKANQNIFLVELFDEYASDKFGKNKKNLAFHIWYNSLEKTLSDDEVKKITNQIIKTVSQKYQAKIRDF